MPPEGPLNVHNSNAEQTDDYDLLSFRRLTSTLVDVPHR